MKRSVIICLLAALAAFAVLAVRVEASDWPTWRGPRYDGSVTGTPLGERQAFGLEVVWRRELGSAYSAVIVSGDTAVTMFSDHSDDFVVALDAASGAERWRHRLDSTYGAHDGSEDGPSGTPTIAGGRVFAFAPKGQLVALDLETGALAWQVDVAGRFAPKEPRFGYTAAPLAIGDLVVVSVGAVPGKAFVAFDAATGEERWSAGDDTVSYESPILATLGGRRQIVGISHHSLTGMVPESGEVLWSFEYHPGSPGGTSQVVPLGDDRLLVQDGRSTVLYRFTGAAGGKPGEPPLEEVWRQQTLGNPLSVPVVHGDHVYGYAGNFLTAISLEDGEKVWKSRPPGGTGLIRLDDVLITIGKGGDVVAVRATPDGYVESARINALDDPGVTGPSFGDDRIFVRNTREIAALRIVDAPTEAAVAPPLPPPADGFEAFVRRAAETADPRAAVRDFMRDQSRFPIVIGDRAHFVYWGAAEDVAVAGTMTAGGGEEQMARIPGTDFFHRSYQLPADDRAEYWLVVDFDNNQPDPLNPRRRAFPRWWYDFEVSELAMPGYQAPAWATGDAPAAQGTVEVFPWTGPGEHQRSIGVYLPPGYTGGEQRHAVAVFLHGDLWRGRGDLPAMLDRAIAAGALEPIIGVFVGRAEDLPWQEAGGEEDRLAFEQALAGQIMPLIAERYRIDPSPAKHVIVGRLDGARPALETALAHVGVFGRVILISVGWSPGVDAEVLEQAAAMPPGDRPEVTIVWSRADRNAGFADGDRASKNRQLAEALADLGYTVTATEKPDAGGWWSWGLQAIEAVGSVLEDGE